MLKLFCCSTGTELFPGRELELYRESNERKRATLSGTISCRPPAIYLGMPLYVRIFRDDDDFDCVNNVV